MSYLDKVRKHFYDSYTVPTLKMLIIVWAILIILLVAFVIDDPWLLAVILAYEVLP